MNSDSNPPFETKLPVKRLLLDPWVVSAVFLTMVLLVISDVPWLTADTGSFFVENLSTGLMLALTIGSVLRGVGRLESKRERLFWRLVGLSLFAWLAGDVDSTWFMDTGNAATGAGVDALYLLFYLGFLLAIDIQPQDADSQSRGSNLERQGSSVD